jgi:signal transduction histidine kinase
MDERLVSGRLVGDSDASFSRLVSLAAHDLRTPLATIHGFAQTLVRMNDLGEPKQRYLEMIDAAALQLAELLDELGVAARIEGDRYEPNRQPIDSLDLARHAAAELGEVDLRVDGVTLTIGPVTASSGPVLLGAELRDLGAAVGVRVIQANGGSVALDGEVLAVMLPA